MHNYSFRWFMNLGQKVPVSILGGTGYSGEELLKILSRHPAVRIDRIYGLANTGKKIGEVFPSFTGILNTTIDQYHIANTESSELFFLALPSGQAMKIVPELLRASKKVIDLSGDYRLRDATIYKQYYGQAHTSHELTDEAYYGIPELDCTAGQERSLVANPGCYPTSAILPLAPLLKDGLLKKDNIVINSLSGVTGAGKKVTQEMSFAEVDSSVKAYKVIEHQHIPEIEQVLSAYTGKKVSVTFTPHLIPIRRGIYTTIVANMGGSVTSADIEQTFHEYYGGKYFVRLRGEQAPEIKHVMHSNFIDIGWKVDTAKKKVILISALDNLIKGAAGQAVQNMNILLGLPEETALN
jgi:N-acetyl-gamma-glutamyl-phosphate reductase